MLRFKIGEFYFGLDPYYVDEMASITAQKDFHLFDLAAELKISGERNYRKAILLKSPSGHVGILAEEIDKIDEFPVEVSQKLPEIIAKTIGTDIVTGMVFVEESICLLLDGEKISAIAHLKEFWNL